MSCTVQDQYVPCGCKAILNPEDPRAEIWKAVFGKLEFPLQNPMAHMAVAEGENPDYFLKGDWKALSLEERAKMAELMAEKFRGSVDEFLAQVDAFGYVPIKDKNVQVLVCKTHIRSMI